MDREANLKSQVFCIRFDKGGFVEMLLATTFSFCCFNWTNGILRETHEKLGTKLGISFMW